MWEKRRTVKFVLKNIEKVEISILAVVTISAFDLSSLT